MITILGLVLKLAKHSKQEWSGHVSFVDKIHVSIYILLHELFSFNFMKSSFVVKTSIPLYIQMVSPEFL